MKHSTNLVIISGPSGSGKDSVIEGMIDRKIPIERVVTSTTREIRPKEKEGREYYFVSKEYLQKLINADEMAEWARVDNDRLYGATKKEIQRVKLLKNKIGIWRIEYKGVKFIKKRIPDILTILIEPPDIHALLDRVRKRGDKNEKEIQERLEYSKEFLKHKNLYDYAVINEEGKLDQTINKVIDILKKEGFVDNIK